MNKLYIVSTPIGNLEDITLRALRILNEVDIIACEDTRHSKILLNKYEIKKPLISYYKNKENKGAEDILYHLMQGKNIAIISDAGSPCISDPGSIIVTKARENNFSIEIVPGASAVTAACALCGIDKGFTFIGFLPEKNKDKTKLLTNLINTEFYLVFFIAPHSYKKDILKIIEILGDREAFAVREMTKIYENVDRGDLSTLVNKDAKGEYVLIVKGKKEENQLLDLSIVQHIKYYLNLGYDKKTTVKTVAEERGLTKNIVYQEALKIK